MSSRTWQVFVAPGVESERLPVADSPWVDDRWVTIPREHWLVIIEFAGRLNRAKAEELRRYSRPLQENEYDYVEVQRADLENLIPFMKELAREIEKAEPLVPEPTEDIPDTFVNAEHVRMLNAVIAVYEEALRLGEPFRGWVE